MKTEPRVSAPRHLLAPALASLFAASVALGAPVFARTTEPATPNILFIYTDDQADWTVGAYGKYPATHTPNIDRLAGEGARFATSYATTPVCSPARVSLLTGRYASEHGVRDFITDPGHKKFRPETGLVGVPPELTTFPELFQRNGYRTGLIGKWHAGSYVADPALKYHPTRHGYDTFMGFGGGGTRTIDPKLEVDGTPRQFKGLCDDILTTEAIAFMERIRDRPFLLSLHLRSPHGAWLPVADSEWALFRDRDMPVPEPEYPRLMKDNVKKMLREYMASVAGVDRNVGELLAAIKRLGLEENTIVVFTSDNGFSVGQNGIWHKGNGLWISALRTPETENMPGANHPNLTGNSLHVPAIVRWPGRIKPGAVIEAPIGTVDWYATLAGLAGLGLPEDQPGRGQNRAGILLGTQADPGPGEVYAEYDMQTYARADMRTVGDGRWKLVVDFLNPWRAELYDLSADPHEMDNLIGAPRLDAMQAKSRLGDLLFKRMREHDDYILKRAPGLVDVEKN